MEVMNYLGDAQEETPQQMIDKSLENSKKLLILLERKNQKAELQPNFLNITDSQGNTVAESSLTPERVLGRGETSLVLSGRSADGEPVAIKTFFQAAVGDKARFLELFSRELQALSEFNHPNIATFKGQAEIKLSEATAVSVLIKELVPFQLEEIYKKTLDPGQVNQLIHSISEALQHINEKGKIVTDLSPENIGQRENGDWVLTDLGMLATNGSKDEIGVDDKYGAPELLSIVNNEDRNKLATPASEVFSLGLIAWSCLTGKDFTHMDRLFKSAHDIISPDNIPEELFTVLKKATAENPQDRYSTPVEFAAAFAAALPNETNQ